MGKIISTKKGVFVSGTTRPVKVNNLYVLRCVHDAARAFHITPQDVADSANNGRPVTTSQGNAQFSWPPLRSVKREWPDYPVVQTGQVQAKPCTVHFKTPGRHGKSYDVDVRSITATRVYLNLSQRHFDTIAHKLPGWQSFLPPCVSGITVRKHGYVLTNLGTSAVRTGDYFHLRQLTNSISCTPDPQMFRNFGHISELPDFALQHGRW